MTIFVPCHNIHVYSIIIWLQLPNKILYLLLKSRNNKCINKLQAIDNHHIETHSKVAIRITVKEQSDHVIGKFSYE